MQRRLRCLLTPLLVALLAPCAIAQTPEQDRQREYYRAQDQQREEQQRRAQDNYQRQLRATEDEKKQQQDEWDDSKKTQGDVQRRAAEASRRRAQADHDARTYEEFKAARAKLLRMPPLPDGRNPLLGRWRVESDGKPQRKDDVGILMGMLANPGAACKLMFGGGTTEFMSKSWSSIDGRGENSLGPISYRGEGKRIWAIPDKAIGMMGFELAQQHRAVSINLEGCVLVRDGAASTSSVSTATPSPSQPSRPPPEVCRNMMLDRLGGVRVDEVRQMLKVRFKEILTGTVPNSPHLRLDARGSACDDPRVNAVLYDFNAAGVLQSVTSVWARPTGPAPAPIFSERAAQLGRLFGLPAPQSPSRLQGASPMARIVLNDLPERQLLLEAYAAAGSRAPIGRGGDGSATGYFEFPTQE